MSDNVTILACISVVVFGAITATFVHSNERDYQIQRACLAEHGNWEVKESGGKIGCRFPALAAPEKRK